MHRALRAGIVQVQPPLSHRRQSQSRDRPPVITGDNGNGERHETEEKRRKERAKARPGLVQSAYTKVSLITGDWNDSR